MDGISEAEFKIVYTSLAWTTTVDHCITRFKNLANRKFGKIEIKKEILVKNIEFWFKNSRSWLNIKFGQTSAIF